MSAMDLDAPVSIAPQMRGEQTNATWIVAALESRELLALCLKKLRGLHKVRIIDASFIWTEPHSRRVKVKLTIQDSVSEGVVLQQAFEVEYVVAYQQCPDCAKSYTANTWRACVQVRQKVPHKRTFLYLEQLILKHDISAPIYWRAPFSTLADVQELVEFIVMDIEPIGGQKGKWLLAEATVARASDLGSNDKTYYTRTHLGNVLHPGDSVMGYMLTGTNFNSPQYDALEESNTYSSQIPDVLLVKKFYARKRKSKNRNWRLKRMNRDDGDLLPKKADQEKLDNDYEMFLRDVEEDAELRATMALYKEQQQAKRDAEAMSVAETDDADDETPKVNMEELLDEFDELQIKGDAP
ncbi:putative 60S ribosomal export protein NMD3 [Glarea lozoyensis 74030]|uniref:60S ribosomal export protein NMD3 n=1 Tax=Glarea lozoyensis (strain ATCC 74030 / MF5533) TaxID=1104152 RepID=H0EP98_GLAL7|nr:putative 60S ribosomal export protein NMD3 [Glarea lozoyensis 74030]